jgi:hypothetical protein
VKEEGDARCGNLKAARHHRQRFHEEMEKTRKAASLSIPCDRCFHNVKKHLKHLRLE